MLDTADTSRRLANRVERVALEAAIQDRWGYRRWYRSVARGLFEHRWDDLALDNDHQIRRLVRQLRRARAAG